MLNLKVKRLEEYLSSVYKAKAKVISVTPLSVGASIELKGFGYGVPYLISFLVDNEHRQVVLESMRPEGFGHEHFSDRAATLLWQHSAFNKLPKHALSVDVGAFLKDGETLKSLGDCCEFFIVTEFVEGEPYYRDLDRIKASLDLSGLDEERCLALSNYLVQIHRTKNREQPELYVRRIRDLIGHGEGIFGLADSYPAGLKYVDQKYFIDFEKMCIEWRWRLKEKASRLSQVHGDFHPWNVLFKHGSEFVVLDRSRGEWGEPADDVAAMTINYLFYSLQASGEINGPFLRLFSLFWRNYLDKSGDNEILSVVQPFYAWRSLVIASPLWYPKLSVEIRKKILNFAREMLKTEKFNLKNIEAFF